MKNKIRILPENLCNKIAAGEVVERPASVVKELLENSLDAGATDIRIEVEGGGKRLIRIIDDGEGMGREDLFLCIERHATSKIASDGDLFRVCTLGFRGEALPSISAVSRMTLRSRVEEMPEGWEIYLEGGAVRRTEALGIPRGTTIEVRDLFFNTPARRKFLRRNETELGHIVEVVTRQALARPQVGFRLLHDGRPLIEVPSHSTLQERVASLLGRPLVRDLLSVSAQGAGLVLRGLLSQPSVNRPTSMGIYTFINGRFIRDRVVQHAVLEGYRNLMVRGRFPVAVLFLEIDPGQVDVNVHPTKQEVRFRDQSAVHDFIANSVREVLRPADWLPEGDSEAIQVMPPLSPSGMHFPAAAQSQPAAATERIQEALSTYAQRLDSVKAIERPPAHPPQVLRTPGFFSSLRIIGQFRNSYILCQDGDDLLLIDQHAAHERIGFEKLKAQLRQGELERQNLLIPSILEFDFRTAPQFRDHLERLSKFGFEVEPFGGQSFALKAVPSLLAKADAEQLLREVAEELTSTDRSTQLDDALDQVLMVMACHGAVRANHSLSLPELSALLRELDDIDFKGHCPHGRPVMRRLTLAEVERMFKRG